MKNQALEERKNQRLQEKENFKNGLEVGGCKKLKTSNFVLKGD